LRPDTQDDSALVQSLFTLTVVTGIVDAVSFLGLDRVFTANMTGNVIFLGFAAAGAAEISVVRAATALCAFACGSLAAGLLLHRWTRTPTSALLAAMYAESTLLLGVAGTALAFGRLPPDAFVYTAIVVIAVAMGLRNAVVRRLAVADLTTTVLTSTVTDLAAMSALAGSSGAGTARRLMAIASMLGGAVAGTLLLRHFGMGLPLFAAALLVMGAAVRLRRHARAAQRAER
jgi:uncharacterized membrane protein YoaK (UPF0700 family)